jgi:hypothetical protein
MEERQQSYLRLGLRTFCAQLNIYRSEQCSGQKLYINVTGNARTLH